jgi:hypothetical protein
MVVEEEVLELQGFLQHQPHLELVGMGFTKYHGLVSSIHSRMSLVQHTPAWLCWIVLLEIIS